MTSRSIFNHILQKVHTYTELSNNLYFYLIDSISFSDNAVCLKPLSLNGGEESTIVKWDACRLGKAYLRNDDSSWNTIWFRSMSTT